MLFISLTLFTIPPITNCWFNPLSKSPAASCFLFLARTKACSPFSVCTPSFIQTWPSRLELSVHKSWGTSTVIPPRVSTKLTNPLKLILA